MKKLLIIILLLNFWTKNVQSQAPVLSLTPLTRVEWIDGAPEFTTPIDLKLSQLYQIGESDFFWWYGIGFGINTNIGNEDKAHGELPIMAGLGGEIFKGVASVSLGAGVNGFNGNPMVGFGVTAYSFPLKANKQMLTPAIINNNDYKRVNKAGYNKPKEE